MTASDPRYRILRRLGQGGMAEVFEAELVGEHRFVRKVAIKRMLPDAAADPATAARFLDEARIASLLHHANLVSVLDLGLLDGLPFHVLEHVDGLNAEQLLQRAGGKLPMEIALAISIEVARGLEHAHAAVDESGAPLGIVHRDVKPSNILLSWNGDVKLGDFGIAVARDRSSQTEGGHVVGTSGFIAPEQRQKSTIDGRTDVFALGLTLHALIAGYTPLRDITVEIAALEGTPIPLDPELPDDVRALLTRAVAVSRLERSSASELVRALSTALAERKAQDPRDSLRLFLAMYTTKTRGASTLDHLLGIEVIQTGTGDVQRFATRAIKQADDKGATVYAKPRSKSRRRVGLLVGLVVAAGTGGVGYMMSRTTSGASAHAERDGEPLDASVVAAVEDAAREDAAVPVDAAAPVAAAPADARPAEPARVVTHRPRPVPPDASPDASPAAAARGNGYIVVYGEANIGAQVFVDGKAIGFAPNTLEVPVGVHQVEIVRTDGVRLPARTVEISTAANAGRPQRLTW